MVIVITGLIALVFALLIYFSGGDQYLFWSIITFLVPTLSGLLLLSLQSVAIKWFQRSTLAIMFLKWFTMNRGTNW